jgi:hypothetical protein
MLIVALNRCQNSAEQPPGCGLNHLEHVVANQDLCFEIQDNKTVVARAACESQPSGSFGGQVHSHKTAINRVVSNVVATCKGSGCTPKRIKMSVVNGFVHMENITSAHVVKGTGRRILVGIKKDNELFPGLLPVE